MRFSIVKVICLLILFAAFASCAIAENERIPDSKRPNILWLFQEDLSPWLGCYGYEIQKGHTPNIDAMAARGVRFSRAFVPAPVCSICRSAIITGCNQIRFGAHEHRSRRGPASKPLPDGMKTIVDLMKDSGYFCFNVGKSDYNFEHAELYPKINKRNKYPWRLRKEGQPFFGQIQLKGGKLNTTKFQNKCDRAKVTIPKDYPQNELYREVVAEHFDSARMDDENIGQILSRLDEDGLTDSTIVVYFSDHGANNLVRHKQQPTEGGSHVPFIIVGPGPWVPAACVRDDLVDLLDLSATTLAWAGIDRPSWMEGQDLFGVKIYPREFVGTARDRCDQTIDRIRSIRTDRFRYTRNYLLDRVLLQPQYRDKREFLVHLRDAFAAGKLDPKLAEIYFGERPAEEFYDVVSDPHQLTNLVDDPMFSEELNRHRKLMDGWLAKGDTGAGNEPKIELEMADNPKWGRGVNQEYESIRTDSDGDGLSDDWESLNGRDPADGILRFLFDCGGWQTEGWTGSKNLGNIAGRQGYLDFQLESGRGTIERRGLKLTLDKAGTLEITARVGKETETRLSFNGDKIAESVIPASKQFQKISLTCPRTTDVRSIEFEFLGPPDVLVEIDSIVWSKK